jgi:hypothetical protein
MDAFLTEHSRVLAPAATEGVSDGLCK